MQHCAVLTQSWETINQQGFALSEYNLRCNMTTKTSCGGNMLPLGGQILLVWTS